MKTIKSLKEITTLEVGDVVVFGDLKYEVNHEDGYFLSTPYVRNDKIFTILNISKKDFVKNLGIDTLPLDWDFPEVKSLEALTATVSALFKEYEKQNELPKTWEEFCEEYHIKEKEAYINSASDIVSLNDDFPNRPFRLCGDDKNLCTSKQEAKAFLALMQLRQLRKAYVKDWEPDWNDGADKFCINFSKEEAKVLAWASTAHTLSFPTRKLATQFLNNFKDLIEIAKPLL